MENEQIAPSQAPRKKKTAQAITCSGCSWQATDRIPKKRWPTFVAFARSTWRVVITIETVDVIQDFQAAVRDNILVTPTLILVAPLPRVVVLGNLSDLPKVLAALRVSGEGRS